MTILKALCFPQPKLQQPAREIKHFDADIQQLAKDLSETLYAYDLIGMAATHVGVMLQMIVVDLSTTRDQAQIFINPKIVATQGSAKAKEAGIAMPDLEVEVERYTQITMQALNLQGESIELPAEGLLARVLQHEIDQMNGILFIDRLSKLKRERAIKKFLKTH